MEPKIVQIEELFLRCINEDVSGPSTSIYIRFWRGQICHDLSCFQNDLQHHIELDTKSIQEWDALLDSSFSVKDLKNYVDFQLNNNVVIVFVNLMPTQLQTNN